MGAHVKSPEVKLEEALAGAFGPPVKPQTPVAPPPPAPKKGRQRGIEDVAIMAEAQRVYNPALPPSKPRGPSSTTAGLGVSPSMGVGDGWGGPK